MNYGLPYKGSKNAIAKQIVDALPAADTFVDLFCGGGAIVHAAKLSGKYKHFIINDFLPGLTEFVYNTFTDGISMRNSFCSREEFFDTLRKDWYNTLCYSFANDSRTYAYGKDKQDYKRALFNLILNKDQKEWKELGYQIPQSLQKLQSAEQRRLQMRKFLRQKYHFESDVYLTVDSLTRAQRIQDLKGTFNKDQLQYYNFSYQDCPIPQGALIYCDIPYVNTNGYDGSSKTKPTINYQEFYSWALKQNNIYISQFFMPQEQFQTILQIEKRGLGNKATVQKLFIPRIHPLEKEQQILENTASVPLICSTEQNAPKQENNLSKTKILINSNNIINIGDKIVQINFKDFEDINKIQNILQSVICLSSKI